MKLSRTERWIISNQYKLLESLCPDEAQDLAAQRRAIEEGFELAYSWIVPHIYPDSDTMSEDDCREALDVLSMFDAIRMAYATLGTPPEQQDSHMSFRGYGGNDEGGYLSFTEWFCASDGGKYRQIAPEGFDFNGHFPMVDVYRRQLDEWRTCEDQHRLSANDLEKISAAAIHPDNR